MLALVCATSLPGFQSSLMHYRHIAFTCHHAMLDCRPVRSWKSVRGAPDLNYSRAGKMKTTTRSTRRIGWDHTLRPQQIISNTMSNYIQGLQSSGSCQQHGTALLSAWTICCSLAEIRSMDPTLNAITGHRDAVPTVESACLRDGQR